MSDQVSTENYPSLKTEYLEIIPNLSNKILYQEIPSSLPNLNLEEKAVFLHTLLKTFIEDNNLEETKFRITYLDDDTAPQAFRAISPELSWVRPNQYSLLALVNFVPELLSNPTANTRSFTTEIREALKNVIEKVEHKAICDIMKLANPTGAFGPVHNPQPGHQQSSLFIHSKATSRNCTQLSNFCSRGWDHWIEFILQ